MNNNIYPANPTTGNPGLSCILLKSAWLVTLIILFSPLLLRSQSITVLSPNGGENWLTYSTQTISWDYIGDPADMMIEYTEDDGVYWYYLAYVPASDSASSYVFENYIYPTTQARVRVSLYNDPAVFDISDSVFTVTESPVYFYSPYYYGESFYRTSVVNISWYSYTITEFRLEYTVDNGANWSVIANNLTDFEYDWTAPDIISDECIIRISDANNPANYGLSPTFSLIDLPVVTLVSPNGEETWNYGGTATVSWEGFNLPYYMYLDYSPDGGQNWLYLGYAYGADTGGTAQVSVPHDPSNNALVRISDPAAPESVFDINDQPFTIFVPPVIVYYPAEGAEFYNKSTTYISWLASEMEMVKIEISTDNGQSWQMVQDSLDADYGYYYWTVSGTPSESCVIRISDMADPSRSGLSGVFTILPTPVVTLTSPSSGDILNTDSTYTITWTYDNEDTYYLYLEFSSDSGQTWNYIGYGLNVIPQGSYAWTTPQVESDRCLIRISDYYLGFVSDTSDVFTIITFPETPICMVTVDSVTNNNIIVWEKPVSALIDKFVIYREGSSANVYEPIGMVDYDELSVFTDTNSNPAINSFRYRLGFMDAEGHAFPMGSFHQTIHLSINQGAGGSWNLIWTDYIGFEVSTYNIYRAVDGSGFSQIASLSSSFNSFTDLEAPTGFVFYLVEVVNPNGCNPQQRSGEYQNVISNIATNKFLGVNETENELSADVYPNPASEYLHITLKQELNGRVIFEMSDLTGRLIFMEETSVDGRAINRMIPVSGLQNGIYLLKISTDGSATTRRIAIRH